MFIDENTIIAGCVGIAGSVHIGKDCMIGGGVKISDHSEIEDTVIVSGGTVVYGKLKKIIDILEYFLSYFMRFGKKCYIYKKVKNYLFKT